MKKLVLAALALSSSFACNATQPPEPGARASTDLISRADAIKAADAALADCASKGQPASVVILDSLGFQRVAFSADGAKFVGSRSSAQKAASVLAFEASTRDLRTRLSTDQQFAEKFGHDERYHFMPGGLPIYRNGKFVAVIAVGGALNIDEECTIAGLNALGWGSATKTAE